MYKPKDFSIDIQKKFSSYKNEMDYSKLLTIPVESESQKMGKLVVLNPAYIKEKSNQYNISKLLTDWREVEQIWYPSIFPLSVDRTRKWLDIHVQNNDNRLLFIIEDENGVPYGHMGLFRGEIDNCLRGEKKIRKGGMTMSLQALLKWASNELKIDNIYLRVFSDNTKAIKLYQTCGFHEVEQIPLVMKENNDEKTWTEIEEFDNQTIPTRWFLLMEKKSEM